MRVFENSSILKMRFDLLFVPDTDLITLQVPGQNVSFVDTFDTVKPKGTSINTYACVPFHSLHGTVSHLPEIKLQLLGRSRERRSCSLREFQFQGNLTLCSSCKFTKHSRRARNMWNVSHQIAKISNTANNVSFALPEIQRSTTARSYTHRQTTNTTLRRLKSIMSHTGGSVSCRQ